MPDTIFSKIIRGDFPCHKVFENEHVLAFLDINPVSPGHTLVIPKEAAEKIEDLSANAAAELGRILPRLCKAVSTATGSTEYNLLQNNGIEAHQTVMHVHFHIIPKPDSTQGLGIRWPSGSLSQADADALGTKIIAELS